MKRALASLFLLACNTTSTTPPTPAPTASAPPPTATASASPAACSTDADCATLSSYCSDLPCACVPYVASAGAPACKDPGSVKCLVDPCQHKKAACQDKKCVVTVAGPAQ